MNTRQNQEKIQEVDLKNPYEVMKLFREEARQEHNEMVMSQKRRMAAATAVITAPVGEPNFMPNFCPGLYPGQCSIETQHSSMKELYEQQGKGCK